MSGLLRLLTASEVSALRALHRKDFVERHVRETGREPCRECVESWWPASLALEAALTNARINKDVGLHLFADYCPDGTPPAP